uniref:Uncharacterized protein n=1 Tax=Ditylenchus dipsaci TaxID=166011 RepID=A0A915D6C0_9BILA
MINETRGSWIVFSQKITKDERTQHQPLMDECEASLKLEEIVDSAEGKVEKLRAERGKLKLQISELQAKQAQDGTPSSGQAVVMPTLSVKLPDLSLPKFKGERLQWSEFWESYKASVHDAKIAPIQKMAYLKSLLKEEALAVVEGLTLSESNYITAVNLLKAKYGRTDALIRDLHTQLASLKPANKLSELKSFHLKLERLCRQLAAAGEDVEGPQTYLMLEAKIPKPYLRELHKAKQMSSKWSTQQFRAEFGNF